MSTGSGDERQEDATLYFGYGSNLWKSQMATRCPESTFLGLARLNGWRWIINDRGYANVVELPAAPTKPSEGDEVGMEDVVWGLVYRLQGTDEARLDVNEGVPVAYTKEMQMVDFWPKREAGAPVDGNAREPEKVDMLVYVDRERVEGDVPKKEYIYRMNMGIKDAVEEGMPMEYVERVMRKFIPESRDDDAGDAEVISFARKQAEAFEDEEN